VKEEKLFEQNRFKSEQSSKMNKEVFFIFCLERSEQIFSLMI
jgi:hypothetical protein